ncbi:DUF927 domain-containing protein [Myxococcota bacterium]|nr:DUF927 domain-containing protein [Myxococcota bacterium]
MDTTTGLDAFLTTLYPDELLALGGAIQVRAFAPDGDGPSPRPLIRWFDHPDALRGWPIPHDLNVYLTPVLRHRGDGTARGCRATATVWVDIDDGGTPAVEAAIAAARELGIPPTLTVESSPGKAHLWWRLAEPLELATAEQRAAFTRPLRALTARLGGDPACAEPARVMRLPGSRNVKKKYGDDAPLVRVVAFEPNRTVAFERLVGLVPPKVSRPAPSPRAAIARRAEDRCAPAEALPRAPALPYLDACLFVRHAAEHSRDLPEPLWARLAWALAGAGDAGRRAFHDLSREHPEYDPAAADHKLDYAREQRGYRPPTCANLAEHGFTCPQMAARTGVCRLRPTRTPADLITLGPAAPGECRIDGGRTLMLDEAGRSRPIAEFVVSLEEERRDDEGVHLQGTIHTPSGASYPLTLPASAQGDLRDLRCRLAAVLGIDFRCDPRRLDLAWAAWRAASDCRRVRVSHDFGFATDGRSFLGLHRDGPGSDTDVQLDLSPSEAASRLRLEPVLADEVAQLLLFLFERWPDIACGPFVARATLAAASHALLAPVLEAQDRTIPPLLLWLVGPSGVGKTTAARLAQCFFGDFSAPGHLMSYGSTPNSVETAAWWFRGALLVIDDAKHSTLSDKDARAWLGFYQRCYDRTGRSRLNADGTARATRGSRATLLVNGEDIPFEEASARARCFAVEATQPKVHAVDAAEEVARVLPRMSGLAAAMVDHLLRRPEWPAAATALYHDARRAFEARLPGSANRSRLAQSAAALSCGFWALAAFAASRGVLTRERETALRAAFDADLADAAARQLRTTEELSPAERYVQDVQAVLHMGVAHVEGLSCSASGPRGDCIGRVLEGMVCILPEASVTLVNRHLHADGNRLPPSESIATDLARLDWIARCNKGRRSYRPRKDGPYYWAIKGEVFGVGAAKAEVL